MNPEPNNRKRTARSDNMMGARIAIGAGIGTALGAALGNIALGLAIGIGIGIAIAIGAAPGRKRKKPDNNE